MNRALALLATVAMLLLAGCGAAVQTPGQRVSLAIDTAVEAVATTSAILDEAHAVLSAVHKDAAERARTAAPDEAAAHAAVDAVHQRFLPAWDAYDRARTVYLAAAAAVRAAELAELAGRQPDAERIAAAIIALMVACEALSSAAAAVGVPAIGGGS